MPDIRYKGEGVVEGKGSCS